MLGGGQPESCDDQEIGSFIMDVTSIRHRISLPIGNTPIVQLDLNVNGVKRLLRLKLEAYNPCGSLKDRIAEALIDNVVDRVDQEAGIIESTSGNLGVAMGLISMLSLTRMPALCLSNGCVGLVPRLRS
jgi:cysteine synthase